jgi:hypothetical protein
MANNVNVTVTGGRVETLSGVDTVRDIYERKEMSGDYQVKVNGQLASMDTELQDYQQVDFGSQTKGGM